MPAPLNLEGQRFGRLVAIKQAEPDSHGKRKWLFSCDCGKTTTSIGSDAKSGKVRSCGCLERESKASRAAVAGKARGFVLRKHGQSKRPEYFVWKSMRSRCNTKTCADYPAYGGRGIKVCSRWDDFANFLADMGARPSAAHSLDRIDNDGDYEPSNCRWADDFQQAGNRRTRGTGEYSNKAA